MRHHDAALAQIAAFRAVVRAYFFPLLGTLRRPLLRFRRQGRNLSIRWIHDKRSPQVESMLSLRPVEPKLMEIIMRDRSGDFLGASWCLRLFFLIRQFLLGVELLAGEFGRAFQRRNRDVRPVS